MGSIFALGVNNRSEEVCREIVAVTSSQGIKDDGGMGT